MLKKPPILEIRSWKNCFWVFLWKMPSISMPQIYSHAFYYTPAGTGIPFCFWQSISSRYWNVFQIVAIRIGEKEKALMKINAIYTAIRENAIYMKVLWKYYENNAIFNCSVPE